MGMNDAGFCLEATQGSSFVTHRSHTKTARCVPCHQQGLEAKRRGSEHATEISVSHWGLVIPAKVFSQPLNWRTACRAPGCLLNSVLPHRQVCREKRRKLISKTGRPLEKKSMYSEKNAHRPLWCNAGEINGFLQRVFLQKFTKSAGKLWH